ncbi:MAG: DnaJ C-terminal domain-containing protein [bacterium]
MKFTDYYQVMDLAEDATQDEIKKTYRRLARKYHPDVSKAANAEERFKELGEAYEVLKDPEKREQYDNLRKYKNAQGDFVPPSGWEFHGPQGDEKFEHYQANDFSDFIEAIFGQSHGFQQRAGHSVRGEDIHYRMQVTLYEAFHGATRNILYHGLEPSQQGGFSKKRHSLNVKIPPGVVNGQQLRLRGKGDPGMGNAPPGDLYLEIELLHDEDFAVDGRNLTMVLPVTPWEISLGADIAVETPGGPVKLKLKANSRSDQKLRLKGKGLPGDPAGDIYCELRVVMPQVSTEQDKILMKQMQQQMDFDPRK